MFFSNKKKFNVAPNNVSSLSTKKSDNGSFNAVPKDVAYLIISFLAKDVKALNHLAMTNSSFNQLVSTFPHEINAKIGNKMFKGSYAQFISWQKQYLDYQHQVEVVHQQKSDEKKQIAEDRVLVEKEKMKIKAAWTNMDGKSTLLDEEKCCLCCCCLTGVIGGSFFAAFLTSWPFYAGACIGATTTTCLPIVVSRGVQCCCGMCVECKMDAVNKREEDLDAKYPEPQLMIR